MAEPRKLTKSVVEGIIPGPRDVVHWDTVLKGFGVKVTPKGRKVFIVQHRPKGHKGAAKKYTIGKYGDFTVQQARDAALDVIHNSAQGIDLGAQQKAERAKQLNDLTKDLVSQFIEKHVSQNRSARETTRLLDHDVIPVIGNKSIHDVTKHDIISIVDRVSGRGAHTTANRTLAAVRKFLNWCVGRGVIETSPAANVAAPKKEVSRDRALDTAELAAILNATDKMGFPFGYYVKLLFLTAQRRGEVSGMRWSEINLDSATWTIPAERAKNGKAHVVHLSQASLDVLQSIPKFANANGTESDLVFTTNGKTSISGFSKAKKQLDELSGVTDWRIHDIRRTVVTQMAAMGVWHHVADAILNHKTGAISGVAAVYQRHEFLDDRKRALDDWAKRLREISDE
ncbi:tyrosine-type recombinase/integrase [Roseibium alexandrii]|uniref:Site-specific recombinase XerD n=1 Tax=Roseibium alexandrii (strain DSM 17067 / NCIMB 14079 / DFL-11) TaxID=244592 RepID=A0A5E8GXF9_ROSAD|nr:site-specific integrase [Roseibium alexandrii]EEE44317.1 Site-specific recombinase XerD [Roseibium alexandrii DFL-11]